MSFCKNVSVLQLCSCDKWILNSSHRYGVCQSIAATEFLVYSVLFDQ